MSSSLSMILALLATSLVTVVSQTLFKQATNVVTSNGVAATYVGRFLELLMMPSFIFALFLYGVAFVIWVWLLSRDSLSMLYPIGLSLNVVFALISAHLFLGESITSLQVAGIFVIIIGIFIVAS